MGFAPLISLLAQLSRYGALRKKDRLILYRDLNHIKPPMPSSTKPLTGTSDRLNRHTTTH